MKKQGIIKKIEFTNLKLIDLFTIRRGKPSLNKNLIRLIHEKTDTKIRTSIERCEDIYKADLYSTGDGAYLKIIIDDRELIIMTLWFWRDEKTYEKTGAIFKRDDMDLFEIKLMRDYDMLNVRGLLDIFKKVKKGR